MTDKVKGNKISKDRKIKEIRFFRKGKRNNFAKENCKYDTAIQAITKNQIVYQVY